MTQHAMAAWTFGRRLIDACGISNSLSATDGELDCPIDTGVWSAKSAILERGTRRC